MKFLFPSNIYTKILSSIFSAEDRQSIQFYPSSLISKNLNVLENAVALIPTLDLLSHKDFVISKKMGISFDASICNSYIYFNHKELLDKEIVLAGDVSSNEAILVKILFQETYDAEVEIALEKIDGGSLNKNIILVGDRNFIEGRLDSAVSFAEEIIEMISAPYVNFVFASKSEESLAAFHRNYSELISNADIVELFKAENFHLPPISKKFLVENLQHTVFSFDEQDIEGIKQLLQLPYYHGIIKDLIDLKFV